MALYWHDAKVALDIIDDPARRPFEGDESYTVLRVTRADLCDYESYRKVMNRLCELLGRKAPTMPDWEQRSRALFDALRSCQDASAQDADPFGPLMDYFGQDLPTDVEILASNEDEGELMSSMAHANGRQVRGVSLWDGPVPHDSFIEISPFMRMSTPEYFFLRKANQLPFAEAVSMGMELCGKYGTVLTQYDREEGYDFFQYPRTSKAVLHSYLHEIRNTKEGKRAKRVLRYVADDCTSPMSCYLYVLLCLPRSRGSYGLGRAIPSGAFHTEDGFMPSAHGDFLAYDLCWPKKRVAMQYTGKHPITTRNFEALQTQGMQVVCVNDADLADTDRFDRLVRKLARLLGIALPEPTESWLAMRKKLRKQVGVPAFDHMRLTLSDISKHKSW